MIGYRKISEKDAEQFFDMMSRLDCETDFMMYEPGERMQTSRPECLSEDIQRGLTDGDFLLAAVDDEKIAGYLWAERGQYRRIAHTAYVVVGILEEYRGHGIGTALFMQLEEWARREKLVRLELTVQSRNVGAVHLYQKCGFRIEGMKEKSMIVNGEFVDEYYMAKLL